MAQGHLGEIAAEHPRRTLDAAALPSCGRAQSERAAAPSPSTDAWDQWLESWHERLEGWWAAAPLAEGLEGCIGALSIHLASRFEHFLRRIHARKTPPTEPRTPAASPGCEWVREATNRGELQLPEFPELPPVQFGADGYLRTPTLLPNMQRLQSRRPPPARRDAGRDAPEWTSALLAGAGVGAGGALLALVSIVVRTCARRRIRRFSLSRLSVGGSRWGVRSSASSCSPRTEPHTPCAPHTPCTPCTPHTQPHAPRTPWSQRLHHWIPWTLS